MKRQGIDININFSGLLHVVLDKNYSEDKLNKILEKAYYSEYNDFNDFAYYLSLNGIHIKDYPSLNDIINSGDVSIEPENSIIYEDIKED